MKKRLNSGLLQLEQYFKNQKKRTGKGLRKRINKNTEDILAAQEDRWKRRENEIQKDKVKLKKILKNKQKTHG